MIELKNGRKAIIAILSPFFRLRCNDSTFIQLLFFLTTMIPHSYFLRLNCWTDSYFLVWTFLSSEIAIWLFYIIYIFRLQRFHIHPVALFSDYNGSTFIYLLFFQSTTIPNSFHCSFFRLQWFHSYVHWKYFASSNSLKLKTQSVMEGSS